ncbi:MAG: hypothetical protein JNM93_08970 [Bacteriovoracaceae bacterium]|nr:hypothetical protein [Bacteriovoracaceae bacterium]
MKWFLLLFLISFESKAQLRFEDFAFPEFVTSSRALAMGNAYISKVDDPWAAFYNPAGLGTVRKPTLHLINLHIETNNNMLDLAFGGNILDNGSEAFNYFSEDGLRQLLQNNRGNLLHNRLNLFPNFTMRNLTVGYFMAKQLRAYVPVDPSFDMELGDRLDHGPIISTNFSLWGGVMKFGLSIAYVQRKELLKTDVDITQPLDSQITSASYDKGGATIMTAGTKLTLPIMWLPTFSAVLRNAAAQKFSNASGAGAPDDIEQTVDLGFSLTPQFGRSVRVHLEANVKDVKDKYDVRFERRAMAGMEIDFSRIFYIRAGYGDGYGSGGIGFRTDSFYYDLTTYATEATPNNFRAIEDRRWVLSLSSGF